MRRYLILLVVTACCALLAAPGAAQFANADLQGRVTSQTGDALPGVTVSATHVKTGVARSALTGPSGGYLINGLRPGVYDVRFELDGFKTVARQGVQLLVGQTVEIVATLQLGRLEEVITVTGTSPLVEVGSKEVGGTITDEEFETLPSFNRSALLFASLLPGVTADPSVESTSGDALFINGQDDNNNSFNIDGANNDDDVIGARAGAQTRTSIEAIQEFQVLTSQPDAEFGRSVGGVLNAVTKSGGNDFSGALWWYRQDSGLNETEFFVEQAGSGEPETENTNQGFNLGGPLKRNKAFFFLNFEDIDNQLGQARDFVGRPDLNFSTTTDNAIENLLGKIDVTPTPSQQLSLRWLREESPQFNQIIGNVTFDASREEDDTDSNWIFSWNSVVGNSSLNIARISFTKEDVSFANPGFNNNGQNFESQRSQDVSVAHPGFTGGASVVAQSRINRSLQFDDTYSFFVPEWNGDHEFRAGVNYSEREEEFTNFGTLNGQFFNFANDRAFDPNDIDTYPGAFTIRVGGGLTADIPDNETLGIFAQDDWQVTPNLTLNFGLRYDEEDITDDSNLAPRFGFSWDPSGNGEAVVRGGYGRYYDRFQFGFYQNFFLDAVTISQGFTTRLPGAGQDVQFFFDTVQQNGLQTLNELRDFLAAQIEGSAEVLLNGFPTVDNRSRVQPYADNFSIGYEREQWRGVAWSIDLIHSENRDTLVSASLNPFSTELGGRPNISIVNGQQTNLGNITTWVNAGESEYDAIQLSLRKRFDGRWGGRISYTIADSESNHSGGGGGLAAAYFQERTETGYNFDTGEIIGQPLQLNMNDPRTVGQSLNWIRDDNLAISGQYAVPGTSWRENEGLIVAGIFTYLSGDRVTLLENSARLDNQNRAPLPAGSYSADSALGRAQQDIRFSGGLNGAENPDFARLDLSLHYTIPVGERYRVRLLADVINVFDKVNWTGVGGTRFGTGTFLVPNATQRPPRSFQIGARFGF